MTNDFSPQQDYVSDIQMISKENYKTLDNNKLKSVLPAVFEKPITDEQLIEFEQALLA